MRNMRKWFKKVRIKIIRLWYRFRYGIKTRGLRNTSLLPKLRKGKYVSVFRKGDYIDIISHKSLSERPRGRIRLIPYQPNHGVMVEFWDLTGDLRFRGHLDFRKLFEIGNPGSEAKSKSSEFNRNQGKEMDEEDHHVM